MASSGVRVDLPFRSLGESHDNRFLPAAYHRIPGLLFNTYDHSDLGLPIGNAGDYSAWHKVVFGIKRTVCFCCWLTRPQTQVPPFTHQQLGERVIYLRTKRSIRRVTREMRVFATPAWLICVAVKLTSPRGEKREAKTVSRKFRG
jgi:hypothetical protein